MAALTPTQEPANLTAGDTAKWIKALPDYPATAGWVLGYTLVNTSQRYTFAATADQDNHLVTVAAATTAAWEPGAYAWRAQVSRAGEVYTVAAGDIAVKSSFASITDARSHARKALANIEAYLENSANLSAASYEIAGRKLQRFGIPELLTLRDRYRAEVAREDAAANVGRGLPDRRRVLVRFAP